MPSNALDLDANTPITVSAKLPKAIDELAHMVRDHVLDEDEVPITGAHAREIVAAARVLVTDARTWQDAFELAVRDREDEE